MSSGSLRGPAGLFHQGDIHLVRGPVVIWLIPHSLTAKPSSQVLQDNKLHMALHKHPIGKEGLALQGGEASVFPLPTVGCGILGPIGSDIV